MAELMQTFWLSLGILDNNFIRPLQLYNKSHLSSKFLTIFSITKGIHQVMYKSNCNSQCPFLYSLPTFQKGLLGNRKGSHYPHTTQYFKTGRKAIWHTTFPSIQDKNKRWVNKAWQWFWKDILIEPLSVVLLFLEFFSHRLIRNYCKIPK